MSYRRIYLASQSPRRQDLLRQVGVDFELLLPDAGEDVEALETHLPGQTPSAYVESVVERKLLAALERRMQRNLAPFPILCADTTVAIGGRILGKPADAAEATAMLKSLSGRSHKVLTAVGVARSDHGSGTAAATAYSKIIGICVQSSRVRFARLSADEIAQLIATGESIDKAGAYALQGHAAQFIRNVQGSPSGIIGLPLFETLQLLKRAGWLKKS